MEDETGGRKDQGIIYDNITGEPCNSPHCIHEKDWGIVKTTLEDHERRITDNEQESSKFNKLVTEVKLEIKGLRGDLKLTQQKNGTQDKEIEGIQKKERAKILAEGQEKGQKRGLYIGAILGAVAGGVATLAVMIVFRVLELFTFL